MARPGDVHEITTDAHDPLGIVFWSWTMVPARGPRDPHGSRPRLLRPRLPRPRLPQPRLPGTLALLDNFAAGPRQVVAAAETPLPGCC